MRGEPERHLGVELRHLGAVYLLDDIEHERERGRGHEVGGQHATDGDPQGEGGQGPQQEDDVVHLAGHQDTSRPEPSQEAHGQRGDHVLDVPQGGVEGDPGRWQGGEHDQRRRGSFCQGAPYRGQDPAEKHAHPGLPHQTGQCGLLPLVIGHNTVPFPCTQCRLPEQVSSDDTET